MKATEAKLLHFLRNSSQLILPIYQRAYSWDREQCLRLWRDILRAGADEVMSSHFTGSIVYIEEGLSQVSNRSPNLVIDGQQRLTTITLLLLALSHRVGDDEPVDGFSKLKIEGYYLKNSLEDDERAYKLLLTDTDRETLICLLDNSPLPTEKSVRILANFQLFQRELNLLNDDQLRDLCNGLLKLTIVDIALTRDQDDPQLIFESMNSTGLELSQADLIRNFILMGLSPNEQNHAYTTYWRPMELDFGQEAYEKSFDDFIRDYITLKTGSVPVVKRTYEEFKKYTRKEADAGVSIDELLSDVKRFAQYYNRFALSGETDPDLKKIVARIQDLKVHTSHPFLLGIYDDYALSIISKNELLSTLELIESYVFRRNICGVPTNTLSKTFATLHKHIDRGNYIPSLHAIFQLMETRQIFPNDQMFRENFLIKDIHSLRTNRYLLEMLENYGRKEHINLDDHLVEFILPLSPRLPIQWRKALGEDWRNEQSKWGRTIGNVTLVIDNRDFSEKSFIHKRDHETGLRAGPPRLNKGLGDLDHWDINTIEARAQRLIARALRIWKYPSADEETLSKYREETENVAGLLSIHQPHLALGGRHQELFEHLQTEIEELDSSVIVEVFKTYVAFKSHTNFVDVSATKSRLQLILNMPFDELNDPQGLAEDVTGTSTLGNGDVRIYLEKDSQIPYIMELILQSLTRQLAV